jgi:ATPase subunit of ABC transporter with duplicated ATPase domains
VIEVEGLKKHMGDKLLIEDLSFSLPPGGIVGVIGPNGAGKSTLFKVLTGQEQPDEGTVEYGDTVDLSYVDQSRDDLKDDDSVWEAITGGAEIIQLGDAQMNSRAYCSAFNFKGGDQQKVVSLLSGGERNRVHMARLLKSGGNVLLLDEPSSPTTVSSSTASARISWRLRARPTWNGSKATSRTTRKTRSAGLGQMHWSRRG